MKMDIVCCHPSGVALQLSLLAWRGIRGCSVGNENLLGVAPMGPDGAPSSNFHVGVLAGGASYCRSAQSDRASEIQDGGWTKHCTTSPSLPPFSYHVHFAPPPPPLPPHVILQQSMISYFRATDINISWRDSHSMLSRWSNIICFGEGEGSRF